MTENCEHIQNLLDDNQKLKQIGDLVQEHSQSSPETENRFHMTLEDNQEPTSDAIMKIIIPPLQKTGDIPPLICLLPAEKPIANSPIPILPAPTSDHRKISYANFENTLDRKRLRSRESSRKYREKKRLIHKLVETGQDPQIVLAASLVDPQEDLKRIRELARVRSRRYREKKKKEAI